MSVNMNFNKHSQVNLTLRDLVVCNYNRRKVDSKFQKYKTISYLSDTLLVMFFIHLGS